MICQLSSRNEKFIRLTYGIGDIKENSVELILQSLGIFYMDLKDIEWLEYEAFKKLRHYKCFRILRATEFGLVLLSSGETNYYNLWCAIFGEDPSSTHRRAELECYMEKKQAEEEQRKKDEEELANASDEELPKIKMRIRARSTMIEDLDLSVRAFHWLKHAGINTVEDLTNMTWDEFLRIRNLGKKRGDEVLLKLEQLGFALKSSDE